MTTQPQRIHHLVDRARRGVILPAEGEQLAGLVQELEASAANLRVMYDVVSERENELIDERDTLLDRATELEADLHRYEEQVVGDLNEANTSLQREVARLTAGQCLDQRAMCEQHHRPPVAGCPYPRCLAARGRDQRAATAPAEHCGNQKPLFSEHIQHTECVLQPGHTGSHADEHGTRWWWTDADVPPPTA